MTRGIAPRKKLKETIVYTGDKGGTLVFEIAKTAHCL